MNNGTIKWYSNTKMYGFILCESGRDVFFHANNVDNDIKSLKENDKVQFDLYETPKGYQAKNVVKL